MSSPAENNSPVEKSDILKCYFALRSDDENTFWLDTVGQSMLTLFWKGDKARVRTDVDTFQVGQVVVFYRHDKMFAHRIVACGPENTLWITKGDTRFSFDHPVRQSEFLGLIDCIERKRGNYPVETDIELAHLSAKLGSKLSGKLDWLPNWLKWIYYFSLFIPQYFQLKSKKKRVKTA